MEDLFYQKRDVNNYDNIVVDIQSLFESYPVNFKENPSPGFNSFTQSIFHKFYRNRFIPLNYRRYLYRGFRQINLDLTWFDEFKSYWTNVLGARSFWGVHDLYFLKNLYRIKAQYLQVPDTDNPEIHLNAWQRPEMIFQLLHLVAKESVSDKVYLIKNFQRLTKFKKNLNILEFGCATAPITASIFEFLKIHNNSKLYISDIQTLPFHYAIYRFRKCLNVIPLLLSPDNNFELNLNSKLDVIFCTAVFEHLNNPIETIKSFNKLLKKEGILFFDYIKCDGDGLDTVHSVRQRDDVLDFIFDKFDIISGTISKDISGGDVIAIKK